MTAAIQSEFRKFFSTRMWWVLAICMMAYFLMCSFGMGWVFGYEASNGGMPAEMMDSFRSATYGIGPSMGYVFPVIIAAVAVTAEYRHNTILPTFLGEPRRSVVMVAKAVAAVPMGLLIGVLGTAASLAGGASGLSIGGAEAELFAAATWKTAGLSVLAMTLWAVVGVGLGMLIISQVGVIIGVLAFTQLVEPLARLGLGMFEQTAGIGKFLPGAASDSVAGGNSIYTMMLGFGGDGSSLSVWQGALVLAGYGILFGLAGYFLRIRRDVA